MYDFFQSYGFQLAIWALLALSAVAVLVFYSMVRRRERRFELAYTYQEYVKLCEQKSEERRHLERQISDLTERKDARDRYQAEEARARHWLNSQESLLRDIRDQHDKLDSLRNKYHEYEHCVAQLTKLQEEERRLQEQVQGLRQECQSRSTEVKDASDVYLTLSQEIDQRKSQAEQLSAVSAQIERQQRELKQATEEYLRVSTLLEQRRTEVEAADTELEQLQARAERFKMENPYLADHQERLAQQWRQLEGQYHDVVQRNRQQWEGLEEQFKRLRDQAQRATTSLSL